MIGSENRCAAHRSAVLLSLQILRKTGDPYGSDVKLYDQYTVEQHYQAWIAWYPEFFRQRMREGLTCEIAHSSSYGLATIGHIASDKNRGSYRGTSRRFGRGGGWDYGLYKVIFDDGLANNSYVIRDS